MTCPCVASKARIEVKILYGGCSKAPEKRAVVLKEYEQRRNRAEQSRGKASVLTNRTALLKSQRVCAAFSVANSVTAV
jgi:hypothetical protein